MNLLRSLFRLMSDVGEEKSKSSGFPTLYKFDFESS